MLLEKNQKSLNGAMVTADLRDFINESLKTYRRSFKQISKYERRILG
jgi:hypothetical protein